MKLNIASTGHIVDWEQKCAAIIPCFNESGRIGPVVEGARRHLPNVIVVDDGSTDQTAREARSAGAQVIRQSVNGGKGSALRAGWDHARKIGFDWALCLDGDGQHSTQDIPKFFGRAGETSAQLIIGNRMDRAGEMPMLRRWANRWMSRCLSDLTGEKLSDSQCGFRLVHVESVLHLPLASSRFVIESETIVAFLAAGKHVEFVPIQVIYGTGGSRICPVRDTWRWMRWWTAQQPASG